MSNKPTAPSPEEIEQIATEKVNYHHNNHPTLQLTGSQYHFARLMFIAGAQWVIELQKEVANAR